MCKHLSLYVKIVCEFIVDDDNQNSYNKYLEVRINMKNFLIKYQVVIGIHYFDINVKNLFGLLISVRVMTDDLH